MLLLDSRVLTPTTLRPQDFDTNTMPDTASAGCQACVTDPARGNGNLAKCIGPPECVAHQFTFSVMVSPAKTINMICAGLRTTLCDELSMNVINGKRAFFASNPNCPAPPPPPSWPCSFDDESGETDVVSWQAGSPFTGASTTCLECLNGKPDTVAAQSTCWGPPACVRPAFAGLVLSSPPSHEVKNMICYGVGIPDGRPGAWGTSTSECSATDMAPVDGKKEFFGCPTTGLGVNFPCSFAEDVPAYLRAKAGTGSMMAVPTMACYRCITANDNKIAKCIGAPACVAATFTPEIMGAGMAAIVNTVCQGLCTDSCSANDISVIEEKQAVLDGGCIARGTPVASTCPPPPPATPTPTVIDRASVGVRTVVDIAAVTLVCIGHSIGVWW